MTQQLAFWSGVLVGELYTVAVWYFGGVCFN